MKLFLLSAWFLFLSPAQSEGKFLETPDCHGHAYLEGQIKSLFPHEEAELIIKANNTYGIRLSLISDGILTMLSKQDSVLQKILDQYKGEPTDEHLKALSEEVTKTLDRYTQKDPHSVDWKFLAHLYGGLSGIVYLHLHNRCDRGPHPAQ